MKICSRFTPRVPQCESAEPPMLMASHCRNFKGALRSALLASLALVGVSSAASAQNVQVRTARGVATAKAGELLVKFGGATSPSLTAIRSNIRSIRATAAPINKSIGATEVESFGSIGWQLVKLPAGMSLEDGIKLYKSKPGVADVEPNPIRYAKAIPNDPAYSQQYGLEKIGAPAVWNKTTGSNSVIVAVVDSGVNYTHEDLAANMWKNPGEIAGNGKDDDGNGYIDDIFGVDTAENDSDPMDANHHGTHCAGIIGAVGNNGTGISGVNWNVKIMACRVLNAAGSGSSAGILKSLQYVLTMKTRGQNIRVVNESLGGPSYTQAEKDILDALGQAGVFVAAAAGNETTNNDSTPSYPASYDCPNIISVAASDQTDSVASFSNYGATSVDLAAPGVDIYSTFWPGDSAYSNLSGTSMATPMVAGAAALLSSFSPSLTPAGMKALLMDSVDPLPQWSGKVVTGGRMNLARALASVDANALPIVAKSTPTGVVTTLRPNIVVNFSKAMNTASVQSNFSITPAVAGTFTWTNGNATMTFTPSANLSAGRAYEYTIKGDALSAAGVKLDGNVNGVSNGSPADDTVRNFRVIGNPSNDNFANALTLSGDSGYVPSFNNGATRETGEPRHGNYYGNGDKSVWFRWTAPVTGNLILNTEGSTFSHVIGVYSGSSVGGLVTEKLGDSNFVGRSVLIELRVQAGVTYSIAIDGDFYPQTENSPAFTDTGSIRLAWQLHRSPSNDFYANAQNISGTSGNTTGNTLGAYFEDGESSHVGADSSVWFRWTAPANGAVTFDTIGTGFDTALSAFTGTPIGSAVQVASDRDGGGAGGTSVLPFTVSAGTTYYISVGGAGYAFYDARGDFQLKWNFVSAPSNNAFASPITLSPATGGSITGSTMGATIETNEPQYSYRDGIASIWYVWTAPANGAITFDTLGSGYDTTLGVFTGNSLADLVKVAENDDNASITGSNSSRVKFTAVGGTTYRIRIDAPNDVYGDASVTYPGTHGSVKLNWAFINAPSNDKFANAQVLNGVNGGVVGSNVGANIEINEPSPTYRDYGASTWYKWIAPSNGAVTFGTGGSVNTNGVGMNTYLAVYTGATLAELQTADYNDDDGENAPTESSRVRFTVKGGTTYWVRVDNYNSAYSYSDSGQSYDGTHGTVALAWDFVGAPSNDNLANALSLGTLTSGSVAGTNVGAGVEYYEDYVNYSANGSVWYRWTAPASGSMTMTTLGSKATDGTVFDTSMGVYTGTTMDNLNWITQNSDDGSLLTSKVTFDAEAGVSYLIYVDGSGYAGDSVQNYNKKHGTIQLNWSLNGATNTAPVITAFSPTSGTAGTAVTIYGSNFAGTNSVLFDGIAATINNISGSTVSVTAPAGVRTGRITVKSPKGSAVTDSNFRVLPTISSFSPTGATPGTQITINGTNFYGVTKVTIGGANAAFTIVSATQITATVPAGAVSGKVTVTTAGGTATSSGNFALPARIDSFTPATGTVGTTVQILGANFTGTTSVVFNTTTASAPIITDTSISVKVPAGATTGLISVITPVGTTKTTTNFVVQTPPSISGFSPSIGKAGTTVTITGTNLAGATAVRFNGVAASNPTITATSIKAIVPATATTGPISVTTPDGTATTTTNFVVDATAPTATITNPATGSTITRLPAAFTGTVNDNSGIANVSGVGWLLARTVNSTNQYWNATTGTWGNYVVNPTTPTRPSTSTDWTSTGTMPSGANLATGSYAAGVVVTDKAGNAVTVFSYFKFTATYTISGRITVGSAGLANVTVTRTGNVSTVTNANGDYTIGGIVANVNVTITPSRSGYTFSPTSMNVAVGTADVTGKNFTATQNVVDTTKPTATITNPVPGSSVSKLSTAFTGTVNDNLGVANVSSVTWLLARTVGSTNQYWNAATGTWGNYAVNPTTPTRPSTSTTWTSTGTMPSGANLPTGSYAAGVVVADKAGNSATVFSYFKIIATYTISGRITVGSAGLANVTVTRTGNVSTVTNANGDYTIGGIVANVNVTITPSRSGYTFSPTSMNVAVGTADVTGKNFTATQNFASPSIASASTNASNTPAVSFVAPVDKQAYAALPQITGQAIAGTKNVYVQLYKLSADGTIASVYDWTTGQWTSDDNQDSTVQVATGTTDWKVALPTLKEGSYSVFASAEDNSSNQSAWVGSQFRIQSGATASGSANPSAGSA